MKTKLEQYIKLRGYTISKVAKEAGVSRPLIHYAINGQPLSRGPALKLEKWSDGFVSAVELAGLKNH